MRLAQERNEGPEELGKRAKRLASPAFPEEVRENAAIQVQLADLFVAALQDKHIQHEIHRR